MVPVLDLPARPVPDPDVGPWCPSPVRSATMAQRWDDLTFLHWAYDPEVVQARLPAGLTVETFAGRAWVALVPFRMVVTRPGWPTPPWAGRFAETNVRTYVRGPDGGTGVWFLSLDAARWGAVLTGRRAFALPYHWAAMRVERSGALVTYRSRRRWPGPAAASHVAVAVGERRPEDDLGPLDHWLTARWSLYTATPAGFATVRADHPPWPLHRARAVWVDDTLVTATGLPAPTGTPLVHWSPGVSVLLGRRRPVAGAQLAPESGAAPGSTVSASTQST